jgi:hypothetical protein
MLNNGITVHTLGGSAITISVSAPSTPNTNDIWIASGTGLISQWNGSSWAPFKFDASATIQAATIITANIAASAITSSLIAAGTVVAGIVDATMVQASSYIATATQGEFLAYSGTPATGNLTTVLAGASGTDTHSNTYPAGLMGQQLTLVNQGSGPPAFSGASVFYSSTAGRPRYVSSVGTDTAIERSTVNVTSFSLATSTTPTIISASMSYLANEGTQSSEYEIEILGGGSWSSAAQVLNLWMYVDSTQNATTPVGAAAFTAGHAFTFRIIATMSVESASTAHFNLTAFLSDSSGNRLPSTGVVAIGDVDANTFDVTTAHTLTIKAAWAVAPTTAGVTTYRTRLTRRM